MQFKFSTFGGGCGGDSVAIAKFKNRRGILRWFLADRRPVPPVRNVGKKGFTSVDGWLTLANVQKLKITPKKTKLKSWGGVLERARIKLRLTRRQVVELFNKQSATPLHEITLYKYEKGKLQLPRTFAPVLAGILQIDPGAHFPEKDRTGKKELHYASLPHTDSEILEFALTTGRLDDANPHLPKVEFKPKELYSVNEVLKQLGAGAIDIALFNTNEFDKQDCTVAKSVQILKQVVRFHSYAILFAPPVEPKNGESKDHQWLSFQELFNRQDPCMSRAARLDSALNSMLAQLWPATGAPAPIVLFAPNSDRETVLLLLLRLAHNRHSEDSRPRLLALQRLVEKAKESLNNEDDCFKKFVECLTEADPEKRPQGGAIFLGTIPQRLIAEERGAGLLMTPENFTWLATGRESVDRILQPTNSLLVNRQAYDSQPEQFDAAIVRWNAAVQHIQSTEGAKLAPRYITGSIRREMSGYVDSAAEDLAARIFGERMIVLMQHNRI